MSKKQVTCAACNQQKSLLTGSYLLYKCKDCISLYHRECIHSAWFLNGRTKMDPILSGNFSCCCADVADVWEDWKDPYLKSCPACNCPIFYDGSCDQCYDCGGWFHIKCMTMNYYYCRRLLVYETVSILTVLTVLEVFSKLKLSTPARIVGASVVIGTAIAAQDYFFYKELFMKEKEKE